MANPRNRAGAKSTTTNTDNEESNMTDTASEPVEATPDANTEAPAEVTPEAPKEAKAPVDHEGNLFSAIVEFATSDKSEEATRTLQEAYRAVPTAARGSVQGRSMKRAMAEGGVDMEVLGEVLDAFNNLPTATKATRTKVDLPPEVAGAIKLAALMIAYEAARDTVDADSDALAKEWYKNKNTEHADAIVRLAGNAVKSLDKGNRGSGGSGTREMKTETLKDLLARNAIPVGAELKGTNDAFGTLNADGQIETKGEAFDNPTAAARVWRINEKTGKPTSTNGWDFWTYEGKSVGDLRVK